MSESTLTPQTAPRTVEALLQETPFKLRLLATELGGLTTEEQKMAWHQMTNAEQRTKYVLDLLKQWDTANPGAARPTQAAPANGVQNGAHVPAPTMQQPPMQAPPAMMPGFSTGQQAFAAPQPVTPVPAAMAGMGAPPVGPAAVSPQAAAQAAAATQTEGGKTSRRQPRNGSATTDTASADLGAQVVTMLQTILNGLGQEAQNRMGWQKQITDMLEEAASSKGSRVTALEQKYNEVAQALHSLSAAVQQQSQLQIWTLMAFLTLAEQQTGASITQILGAAIADSAMFQKLVDQATGKA